MAVKPKISREYYLYCPTCGKPDIEEYSERCPKCNQKFEWGWLKPIDYCKLR